MKHSDQHPQLIRPVAGVLFPIILLLVLLIPNFRLNAADHASLISQITNILLPAGLYSLLIFSSRKIGRTALWLLPLFIYAAFQIVLLYLYGEAIIAVDMFINVVTTNSAEVGELLGNLTPAIIAVCILYGTPLLFGGVLAFKKKILPDKIVRFGRLTALIVLSLGVVSTLIAYGTDSKFKIHRDIFPLNVISNTGTAVIRTYKTAHYPQTSADFSYHARSERPDTLPETYVLVIGETGRADRWQLLGYDRPTNPRLSKRSNLLAFPNVLSESNTTHKAVPLILSAVNSDNFADSIYTYKSLITAFKEAGFFTAFLSNQAPNRSFIDFYAQEVDTTLFLSTDEQSAHPYDLQLIKPLNDILAHSPKPKNLIVLHTYGSHFNYSERYPSDMAYFKPDRPTIAKPSNRQRLNNAYDNTIRYTDLLLDSVITVLESRHCPAAMIYLADHGEDIFDDSRNRFLHASPTTTFYQLHVPLIIWFSPQYEHLRNVDRVDTPISSTRILFDTLIHLAGISTPYADPTRSLFSPQYTPCEPVFLNDYNEPVPLTDLNINFPDK